MNTHKTYRPRSNSAALVAATLLLTWASAQADQAAKDAAPTKAASTNPNSPPVQAPDSEWPEGTTIAGRVVDFQGTPVRDAEVVLLGVERIIVDIHPPGARTHMNWLALSPKGTTQKPPSTHTDINGQFTIKRISGSANRIAVIADDPLLWIVYRKDLPRDDKLKIELPQSGNLVVHCDLPGKPEKMPLMVQLHTHGDLGWDDDLVRFHFADHTIDNPGQSVFENLPPGKCAVERNHLVPTGERSQLINLADRQLVDIESSKAAAVRFEHKAGNPLTGRVRGLENVEIGFAHVTLSHFAKQEVLSKDGRRASMATALDVITIQSDGKFTTDPVPPGKYWIDVHVISAGAPKQAVQPDDYTGHIAFTIPESGEMPIIELDAKRRPP